MRLSIPIWDGKGYWTDAEVRAPTPGVLADTEEAFKASLFRAVLVFVSGVVAGLSGEDRSETARDAIRHLCKRMPYLTAEPLAIYSLLENDTDDGIEGIYTCPRCGTEKECLLRGEGEDAEDTRDHVRALPLRTMQETARDFLVELKEPVQVAPASMGGKDPVTATSFTMRYPTLADCIVAEERVGMKAGNLRHQIETYSQALLSLNGEPVSAGMGPAWGTVLFSRSREAMIAVAERLKPWGIDPRVRKVCGHCGKSWEESVSTSNFFASALAS